MLVTHQDRKAQALCFAHQRAGALEPSAGSGTAVGLPELQAGVTQLLDLLQLPHVEASLAQQLATAKQVRSPDGRDQGSPDRDPRMPQTRAVKPCELVVPGVLAPTLKACSTL